MISFPLQPTNIFNLDSNPEHSTPNSTTKTPQKYNMFYILRKITSYIGIYYFEDGIERIFHN